MVDNMGEGEPHMCEERVQRDTKVRADLQAILLVDPEEVLFTDGCCYRHPIEGLKAAYAVVRQTSEGFEEVLTGKVTGKESAQLAELQAMIAALEWSGGKRVNIYTDSAYVAGAIQVELSQWIRAGFLIAAKTPIKHEKDMKRLAEALMKPAEVALVKCRGHDKADTVVAKGNQEADSAAKKAAG
ncbi:ribonuclease H-like, partial [Chiloscyllium plagiosum]|uniref:ribonuclease H-like n=1 Tax=Chiloscyllium plagiosum TaxID=36176 RepID=UPI001CB869E2